MIRRCEVHEVGQSSNPCMNIQNEVEITTWELFRQYLEKNKILHRHIFFINRDKLDL